MTNKNQILSKAVILLENAPGGIRFGVLRKALWEALPDIPKNTIHGNIWNLDARLPDVVFKPAKGLFLHRKFADQFDQPIVAPPKPTVSKIKEEQFYKPFAEWLVDELEECTKAVAVGGSMFKDKWGTPDVIGIRAPRKSDIIQAPTEIVAGEIKIDAQGLIVAFGQACAYKLFAHRSHIVVPNSSSEDDISRLDALCLIHGIGLVLFDATSPESPVFQIRVRAARHEPDMFYVNQKMKLLEDELFS